MTQDNSINQPDPQNQSPNPIERNEAPAPASVASAPRKRKWLRRTLFVAGGLLIVLLILVLLIPTIASMGFVRSIVVNKVNNNLNGRVQIASWSLGWTGGVKVDGIKVFDDQNRQILEIPHVSTQLSLINAITGNYVLGDTVVEGLDFDAIRYPDGSLNFEHLAKTEAANSHASGKKSTVPSAPSAPVSNASADNKSAPTKLPNVSGQLRLVQCRGTVENINKDSRTGAEQHDMVKFPSIQGDVKIPGINQTITDSLEIVEDNGMSQPGKLNLSGQMTISKNNILLPATQMDGNQNVVLNTVELKGFAWAMPGTTLAGNTSGNLTATLVPGTGATIAGSIQSAGFKFGGPALQGDTYSAISATITIPPTLATLAQLNDSVTVSHLRIGDGSGQAINLALVNSVRGQPSQSTVKLSADTSVAALQNLAANKAPGANGSLRADVDLDAVPLAEMVPHVLKMIEGSKLDSGRIVNTFAVQMSANKAIVSETLAVSPITGENAKQNKIAIDPIKLALTTTDRGGGGKIPDLRNSGLNLTTATDPSAGWITANITAPTLTALKGAIHADLQRAQQQLGQLIDFGDVKLAGVLETTLTSEGDLVGDIPPGQTSKNSVAVKTTISNLVVDGIKDKPPIKEPQVSADLSANIERGADGMVEFVRDFKANILAGGQAKPSVTVTAGGNLDLSQKAASQETIQYNVLADLPELQNEFGAFMSSLSDSHLQFTTGALTVAGNLKYNGTKAVVQPQVKLDNVSLDKDKGVVHVLKNYTLTLDSPLTYESSNGRSVLQVDALTLTDNTNMLRLESAAPITIVTTSDGRMQPTANLHITSIDLKQLNDLLQSMSTEAVVSTPEGTPLKSGILSGTAKVNDAGNHQIALTGDLAVNGLTITAPQAQGLQNEQVKLALDIRAADDLSAATVNRIDAAASFLNAHIGDTQLLLKQGSGKDATSVSTLDMIRKFSMKVDVPALEKFQLVMDAFSPTPSPAVPQAPAVAPRPAPRAGRTAAEPAQATEPAPQPTKLGGGTATLTLNGSRQGDRLSIVPVLAVRNLLLRKPDRDAPVGAVDVKAQEIALVITAAPQSQPNSKPATHPVTAPSIMDQIHEMKIGQLVAQVSGAELDVNGSIVDLANTRSFQGLGADLTYDAPKLWQVLVPLMFDKENQAKWKDAKVAGSYKKHITIAGSYPTTLPSGQPPITMVSASGDIALDHFEGRGAALDKFVLPFNIDHGIASITYPGKPAGQNIAAPASLNGGTLDIGGLSMDMNGVHPLLNIPAGKKLLDNVSLNPTFAQFVGDWVNNPMFVTANEAAGQMFFTINKCENLPMDDTLSLPVASNTGVFDADIKVNKIQLGNDVFQKVSEGIASAKVFGGQTLNVKSFQGDISKWHVTIEHGITRQDMTMTFGQSSRPLHLTGDVVMQTRQMNMLLDMPWDFFGLKNNKSIASLTGNGSSSGVSIPLTGPVTNPQFDLSKAIQKNLVENAPQNIVQSLLGQNKDKTGEPTTQPDKSNKDNPLGALQDLLNQNKKEKKK